MCKETGAAILCIGSIINLAALAPVIYYTYIGSPIAFPMSVGLFCMQLVWWMAYGLTRE